MFTILELADKARVSKEKARYWLKLLDLIPTKREGKLYYCAGSDNLLIAMKQLVSAGMPPVAAASEAKHLSPKPITPAPICNQDNNQAELADLKKAVLLLAETVEKQSRQIEQQSTMIERQARQLDTLTAKLLPAPAAEPVKVWQPAEKKAPKVSWFKRAWLELFDPSALRASTKEI